MMFNPRHQEKHGRLEWVMVLGLLALMVLGTVFIYSARRESPREWWLDQMHVRQIIWYGVGLGAALGVCLIEYNRLARWSLVAYWATILLLIAVLIDGIGTVRLGAQRWIDLGFFSLQPSEFAKLAFILAQANFLSRPVEELRWRSVFWQSLGLSALPFALILKEPDLGSALVFFPIGIAMMFVAGVPIRYLGKLLGTVGVLVLLLLGHILFAPGDKQLVEEYQRQRLLVFFGREFAPRNATPIERERYEKIQRAKSYNIEQALISVGSGGLTGKGWRQGTQNALGYLPRAVAHNDFIFSVIAEEKGFLGSSMVIILYTLILFSGIKVATQARDRLGKILATGVVALFFCHVFINIGMNIRIMPVTGIPLPLLSYGGSSVFSSLIAAGILQNIYIYRRVY